MHFDPTQQTPDMPSDWLWFKCLQCLVLLWHVTDSSVALKKDTSMNLHLKRARKEYLQENEGHLSLVPYCTKHRNEFLYAFLSSGTDCIWTQPPQHPDKPALPETQTSLRDWNLNNFWIYRIACTVTSKFYSKGSPLTTGAIWKE
jgi:hypothetical protein